VASDAGVRLQLETGIAAHRRRTGGWGGGLWLPECAHAPWLDEVLTRAGARVACVELTRLGLDPRTPLRTAAGVVLAPIDRPVVDLVWGRDGYPGGAAYRDSHRRTRYERRAWRNDGAVYAPAAAAARVRADARDFVARVRERGSCVVAIDSELLGDWWYEGVAWLEAMVEACADGGVELVALDEAAVADRAAPAPPDLPVTTWGAGGDLRTWSAPGVARIAVDQRHLELNVLQTTLEGGDPHVRRLLAVQASDWAFAISTGQAAPYAWERHAATMRGEDQRGLAPWATPAPLLVP
jgi:1,4-alpha-glucan branching enzyme